MRESDLSAEIHSFESFGTVDGPGIRYVIFFQGCNLNCLYCHNRDMWSRGGGQWYTVPQLVSEIVRYEPWFRSSGGGVTASGGEPLLQPRFIADLFAALRRRKIHTALDTAGCLPCTGDVTRVLENTDLVLLDIKHIDKDKAHILTGRSNRLTLDFARYLSDHGIPAWIRYVVLPGYSDAPEDVRELAAFLRTLDNIEKIECLPYHTLGSHKWQMLDETYELADVPAPSGETVQRIKEILSGSHSGD